MTPPLISVDELARRLDAGQRITLLDVRWSLTEPAGLPEFRRGHIPGAQFVDLDAELAAPPGPGRHPLPDAAEFAAAMRRHGVRLGEPVVVYDAGPALAAARAWWDLRYFGHRDVRVLDGGLAAWAAAGRPLSTEEAAPEEGDFVADAGHMPMLDAAGAGRVAQGGLLLDARAPERFRGDVEPVDPVAGHIPRARNLPTAGNVDASGRFLGRDALRQRFQSVAGEDEESVGVYCGSGVTAAHEVLALASAGIDAALYVGSWSEWITDPSRPVATGQD